MEIPGLGTMTAEDDWHSSDPVRVPVLGGAEYEFLVVGYADDDAKEDFHRAIATFLALDESALHAATDAVHAYYRDVAEMCAVGGYPCVDIARPEDVWQHVRPGPEPMVERDGRVYVSVEAECDWEPEHGLQIVFRDGAVVTKVGPYDSHVTNASAFGRDDLGDVVYVSHRDLSTRPRPE
ncbi:DUF6985 domain-containing protein [Micromonosporaceae bacterium Da 78-11]